MALLKKNAYRNAKASGLEIVANKFVLSAAVSTALVPSIAPQIPAVLNSDAITPRADSFPIAEATKAINNCHGRPKNMVTGSIKVPIR